MSIQTPEDLKKKVDAYLAELREDAVMNPMRPVEGSLAEPLFLEDTRAIIDITEDPGNVLANLPETAYVCCRLLGIDAPTPQQRQLMLTMVASCMRAGARTVRGKDPNALVALGVLSRSRIK